MTNPSPKANDPDDDRLLRAAQSGNLEAFAALSQRLRPALLRYANTFPHPAADADGEDLVQEALLRLLLGLNAVRDADHFRCRAYQTVKHLALDRIRIFKNRRTDLLPESFESLDALAQPDTSETSEELQMSPTYLAAELKPLTRPLGEPRHHMACWMLDVFAATGEFPTVRNLAARWHLGHGTAADYCVQFFAQWQRILSRYGLMPFRDGKRRRSRPSPQSRPPSSGEQGESSAATP